MNVVKEKVDLGHRAKRVMVLLTLAGCMCGASRGQDASAKKTSEPATQADGQVVGDTDQAPTLPKATTVDERSKVAWGMLSDALGDAKHSQTRIQALAGLSLLRSPRAEKMITDAMGDPDLDVRTAAALAAGETRDRNLTTPLRNLLDDKEPQVAFTAAMTLYKMGDKSGEDILVSVVDGERSANPTMMHGTGHTINKDLHDPGMLAKIGVTQGAGMLLGPFGFGITAFEYMHKSGGDLARVSAIEEISQERIEPIHKELLAALGDKDLTVRAAAAKALMVYHDKATSDAVFALLADNKQPVRLTAAAAYLRTTGTPGPPVTVTALAKPTR